MCVRLLDHKHLKVSSSYIRSENPQLLEPTFFFTTILIIFN